MKYTISYEYNSVYQCIGVNAQTAEQAAAYFAKYRPSARIRNAAPFGVRVRRESPPGADDGRRQNRN